MSGERLPVSSADIDDLDLGAVEAYLKSRAPALLATSSRDDAALRVGLVARVSPRLVPTTAGLYVFGRTPQFVFPEWGVACVAFDGTTITDPIRQRADLAGGLGALLDGGLAFVESHCVVDEHPEGIVREALSNALVHRDLKRPSRVAVRVFSDRVEVWSPGGPPEGIGELDEMAREGGVSIPRNPLVASIARHLLVRGKTIGEHIGRGLALMMRASSTDWRVELRASPREMLAIVPSRWNRPRTSAELS